jgi:DNA-binding transcriptional MerR regulator
MRQTPTPDPARPLPYRMKDLSEKTGLPRQVIHFYIQQGLVPEGKKTGRNMAWYGDEHVARIQLVRRLQNERFLPLKAIRAVVGETEEPFTPEQTRLLVDLKARIAETIGEPAQGYVEADEVLARTGVSEADLREMIALDLVRAIARPKKKPKIARDDVWILETWGEIRGLGFSRELGFSPRDMAVVEDTVQRVFAWERATLTERLEQLPPEQLAFMLGRALPLLNAFLVRSHERKIRTFFAQFGEKP